MKRVPLFMANWKMNKTLSETSDFMKTFETYELPEDVDIAICAPFPSLVNMDGTGRIGIGAENIYPAERGAFTGEISAEMLLDMDVRYVIVGHSERRELLGETNEFVGRKYRYCATHHLTPVLCVGETLKEREEGMAEATCFEELDAVFKDNKDLPKDIIIAYEPIWAIGTGRSATPDDAQYMASAMRAYLGLLIGNDRAAGARILYGGSAKPENIASIMAKPDVDGALVGGASLKPESFLALIEAGREGAQ